MSESEKVEQVEEQIVTGGTITRKDLEEGVSYEIREGLRYEVQPGGYVKLRRATIGLGRRVDEAGYERRLLTNPVVNPYDCLIEQVKLCSEDDGVRWDDEDTLDPDMLTRVARDFLLRSLGRRMRPGKS